MSTDWQSETTSCESAVFSSKYSIARKNRSAKYKFLYEDGEAAMSRTGKNQSSPFQRNSPLRRSLPGYSRTESHRYSLDDEDESEFDKRDLSIPGTPVSSRHVMSLKYRNQLAEKEKREKEKQFEEKLQATEDPLLKFIESMQRLATMKREDYEQGIVREPANPRLQTPPSPLVQSRSAYNRLGSWNGDSNLRAYTPLFQRSMTVKLASINVDIPKPNPVNGSDKVSAGPAAAVMGSGQNQTALASQALKPDYHDWGRPNLPKPPTSMIIRNPTSSGGRSAQRNDNDDGDDEEATPVRRPLKHRSLSNADTFYEIRNRLER